jgi:hypothetical protein
MVVRASVALVSVVALAIAGAAVGGHTSTSAVKLTTATATAHWNQGYLKPGAKVMFAGTVGAPSHLSAVLRPDGRPGVVTARTDFAVAAAGPFTAHIKLPPRPIPGKYTLSVSGKSGTTTLDPVKIAVTIPSPPEGVLDQAQVGTGPNGPWQVYQGDHPPTIKGSHKELWMRFRYLYPPSGKNVQLVWKMKWHRVVGKVTKRYKDILETSVASAQPLPAGHWVAVLKFDGVVSKKMDVIVST